MNFPNMICMQMNTYELIEKKKACLNYTKWKKNRQNTELHTMQLRPHDFSVKPKSAYKKLFVDVFACGEGGIFQKKFFLYNLFDFFYRAPNLFYLALFSAAAAKTK